VGERVNGEQWFHLSPENYKYVMKYTHRFVSMSGTFIFGCTEQEYLNILPLIKESDEWVRGMSEKTQCSIFQREIKIVEDALKQMRMSTQVDKYIDTL